MSFQIPLAITPQYSGTFYIPLVKYDFLSLLPTTEILSTRGKRLNATPAQRQEPTYAPDVLMRFTVAEATHKLVMSFVEDGKIKVLQGEKRLMNLWVVNLGSRPIRELWVVPDPEDEIWIGDADEGETVNYEAGVTREASAVSIQIIKSSNSLVSPQPLRIPVPGGVLRPEDGFSVPLALHTETIGEKQFCLFFVYREVSHSRCSTYADHVQTRAGRFRCFLYNTNLSYNRCASPISRYLNSRTGSISHQPIFCECLFEEHLEFGSAINADIDYQSYVGECTNGRGSTVEFLVFFIVSLTDVFLRPVLPSSQSCNILLKVQRWTDGHGAQETVAFIHDRIADLLNGRPVGKQDPPPLNLCCSSITEVRCRPIS